MAFPSVVAPRQASGALSSSTSHAIAMPASATTARGVLVVTTWDSAPVATTASSGWTKIAQSNAGSGSVGSALFYKRPGVTLSSLTVSLSFAEEGTYVVLAIDDAEPSENVTATSATATTANGNPPNHVPAGGARDYLWIAAHCNESLEVATTAPSGFANLTAAEGGSSGASTATAERTLNAASLDPGAFVSPAEDYIAWTIAVPPLAATDVEVDDTRPAGTLHGSPTGETVEALSIHLALDDVAPGAAETGSPAGESIAVGVPDIAPSGVETGAPGGELVSVSVSDTRPAGTATGAPTGETVTADEPGLPAGGAPFVSLWAVHPTTGALVRLPHVLKVDLSPVRNQAGAFRFDYPAFGRNFDLLHDRLVNDQVSLELELWVGGSRFNSLGGDVLQAEGDDVAEDSVWSFAGKFFTHRLSRAVVKHDPSDEKGERKFSAATAGTIMRTFLQEAQGRGTITEISYATFSTTHDSAGVPWAKNVTMKFSPYGDVLTVMQRLVALGMCEGEVDRDKRLLLYNPGGAGRDLTTRTPPVILRRGKDMLESNRRIDVEEAGTDFFGTGAEGLYASAFDASARARWGEQIERAVDSNQLTDQGALLAFVQAARTSGVHAPMELTHGLVFGSNRPAPVSGFRINDWLYSDVGRGLERVRVAQWVLSQDVGGIDGSVTLNDVIADKLTRLSRQLAALADGSAVVGTSTASPVDDITPPAAPTGLVVDSIAYQDDEHSQTLAAVTVGWSPVVTNADGPTTPQAQAAQLIVERFESGLVIAEDWTWPGSPQLVNDHNDALLAAWNESGDAQAWLVDYVSDHSDGASATDDVAGYKVQLAYLGMSQVGGIPSSNPVDQIIAFNEVTPSNGITATTFTFGGVESNASVAVRVAAFDRSGNQGPWSVPLAHTTAVDNVPPEQAAAPTLAVWFRTVDITSDGLDVFGGAMPSDWDHDEIWVSRAASFTVPATASTPVAFDPTSAVEQHVANLYGAGTWNQPDIPVGIGYYAARRSVDRAGNAGELSPIAGPVTAEQLVSQDLLDSIITAPKIADFAVESAKIVDLAVVNAKIGNLAVNDAKIETLSVGKLTAGTMTATVTNSGLFRTASTGNRVEFDGAGIRLYSGTTVVGRWQTSDASMLMTGTYQSGLSGERINIFPDGTLRFYPASGTNYSQISNFGNDLVMRGVMDSNGRSGRINVNAQGIGMNFSAESEIPSNLRAEFAVFDRRTRITAPFQSLELNGRLASPVGGERRIQFSETNSSGATLANSFVSYQTSDGGVGGFTGNGGGIKFEAGQILITTGGLDSFGVIKASDFVVSSSETVKDEIEDIRAILDPLAAIRAARARKFVYTDERWYTPPPTEEDPDPEPISVDPPERFGVLAEELPPQLVIDSPDGSGGTVPSISIPAQVGVLWGAIGQIAEDMEIRYVHASQTLSSTLILQAGQTRDVALTWDEAPLDKVRGADARLDVGVAFMGKATATVIQSSVTDTGCTVRIRATATVVINTGNPLTVHATAAYLYSPPFDPEDPA